MRYHEIILENINIDPEPIITKMVHCVLTGTYWDDQALAHKPELGNASDSVLGDMLDTFSDSPEDRDRDSPEVRALVERWARARYQSVSQKLSAIPKAPGGLYRIHRVMTVPLDRFESGGSLGRYWTYDLESWNETVGSYAVWSQDSNPEVLIEALVSPSGVDWTYTILANMDWFSGDNEFEMRLLSGAEVKIVKVFHGAEEVEIKAKNGLLPRFTA